jgi:hypothetical protein
MNLIIKYTLILTVASSITYAQKQKKEPIIPPESDYYVTSKETYRYATFKFDAKRDHYIFDKNSKPASLSSNELTTIESLIAKEAMVYNRETKAIGNPIKNPKKYYKQLIAIINNKGEKEVWVNCCCSVMHGLWKTQIQHTSDGGSCFFTIKINLTKKKADKLNANGLA